MTPAHRTGRHGTCVKVWHLSAHIYSLNLREFCFLWFVICFSLVSCFLAWAERRGYKTAKAARNDVYRAANSLLRLAIDGRLCLCLRPPGYSQSKGQNSNPCRFPHFVQHLVITYLLSFPSLLNIVALTSNGLPNF